ncbi:hypothetical protein GWK47_006264 [Chionoecetes opilio]|uniref:CCHC-type domain-containing protein n=1 Tax=Chionoecetes opilio TaxID=41210 RepID=A0A8J5CH88_CHIOP|nr:hypothetical protein GWK47_006264 [Chionoecetes opilio]
MAGADVTPDDVSDDDFASRQLVVAASRHNSTYTHKSCRWCGYKHAPDRASCPAQGCTCDACGKPGHFKRRCKSYRKREGGKAVNSVTVGAAGIAPEPLLQVQLAPQVGGQTCTTTAVADTGPRCVWLAQPYSIARSPACAVTASGWPQRPGQITLACLGAAPCHISLPGRSTLQEVHFVKSVERLYLSCPPLFTQDIEESEIEREDQRKRQGGTRQLKAMLGHLEKWFIDTMMPLSLIDPPHHQAFFHPPGAGVFRSVQEDPGREIDQVSATAKSEPLHMLYDTSYVATTADSWTAHNGGLHWHDVPLDRPGSPPPTGAHWRARRSR